MFVYEEPWEAQPQEWAAPSQELLEGLLAFICPGFGDAANIVTGDPGTDNGAMLASGAAGRAVHTANGGTQGRYYPVKSITLGNPWSLVVWFTAGDPDAATPAGIVQVAATTASSISPQILLARTSSGLRMYDTINSYTYESTLAQGTSHCAVITYDGATKKLFRNGALRASIASANLGANTATHLWLGNGYPNSGLNDIYLCAYLSRALSSDFALALSANPMLAFEPRQQLVPVVSSVSAWWPGAESTLNGWTASNGGTLASCISETTFSDAEWIEGPVGSNTPDFPWAPSSLPAGNYDFPVRAYRPNATGQIRSVFLDGGGGVLATGAWHALTGGYANYSDNLTIAATSTHFRLETQA